MRGAPPSGRQLAVQLQRRIRAQRRPIPRTAWSFAPNRVFEHPDIVLGSYISEPFLGSYISEPFLGVEPPATTAENAQNLLESIVRERGYTLVPSRDMRDYVRQQLITAALGFGAGVMVGAIVGPASVAMMRSLLGRR